MYRNSVLTIKINYYTIGNANDRVKTRLQNYIYAYIVLLLKRI